VKQLAGETVLNIVGNLTADPELRYTQAGVAVANMTIAATPRTFDSESKEWKDGEALFMQATAWKELAEHVAASLTKGARVIASGRLKQRSYETKEGQKRTVLELELDEIGPSLRYATTAVTRVQKGSGGQQAGPAAPAQNKAQDTWAPAAPAAADPWSNFGDETPF
jgi:single-strand DNA-binding protein